MFLICSTLWHAFCAGVTTIAGGKWGHAGGHVDGPSEDAKFSNDFDVVYVGSSCSLLVVDRGNHAIREIQLHQDDCTTYEEHEYYSFNLGMIPCNIISFIYLYPFTILEHVDLQKLCIKITGIAVLVAAGFFGYMLALLQWRVRAMFSSPAVSDLLLQHVL